MLTIDQIKTAATRLADTYPVKKVLLFGSYADGTANEASDVDLLVEFHTTNVSLFTLSGIKSTMEDELKKDVDVIHAPVPNQSLLKMDKVIELYEQ
jgi:predicted nucleotidyltransferase